ncbi:MAG: cobalamin biosynthesis protein CobD/CbiB [Candidatus Binataceae bacterium]
MSYAFHLPAIAIIAALALELLLGDPRWIDAPARLVGGVLRRAELALWTGDGAADIRRGALLAIGVIVISALAALACIAIAASTNELPGAAVAVLIAWSTLSFRTPDAAAHQVQRHLAMGKIDAARGAMSTLVSLHAAPVDSDAMIRIGVEAVAVNAFKGAVAPIFFLLVGGPVLAIACMSAGALGRMTGTGGERHRSLGRAAARINEVANFIPARVTAVCIAAAAATMLLRGRAALATCTAEARRHDDVNAGWPIAAMAGALGIRLSAPAESNEGEIEPATFGRDVVPPAIETIAAAREVMRSTVFIAFCALAMTRYLMLLLI